MTSILMVLTNSFEPDVRVYKEAKYLVKIGCKVEIAAWDRENDFSEKPVENNNGILIKRFFGKSRYGSGLKQLPEFLKFKRFVNRLIKNEHFDFIHCHDLDGCVLTKKRNIPFIFDMHEFYYHPNRFLNLFVRFLVHHYQNKAFRILYVNDFQFEGIAEKNRKKCLYLPNYPDGSCIFPIEKPKSNFFRVSYYGGVRQYAELKTLCDCAKYDPKIFVRIVGSGVCSSQILAYSEGVKNIVVEGVYNAEEESARLYSMADLIFCIYPKTDTNLLHALPVKFYESIATGTPMIANEGTEMAKLIGKEKIGFLVKDSSFSSVFSKIEEIIKNPSQYTEAKRNVERLSKSYSWESVCNCLSFYQVEKR